MAEIEQILKVTPKDTRRFFRSLETIFTYKMGLIHTNIYIRVLWLEP